MSLTNELTRKLSFEEVIEEEVGAMKGPEFLNRLKGGLLISDSTPSCPHRIQPIHCAHLKHAQIHARSVARQGWYGRSERGGTVY